MPVTNRIKICFSQGMNDETTHSKHSWSVAQPSKLSYSIWKLVLAHMSNSDGTF